MQNDTCSNKDKSVAGINTEITLKMNLEVYPTEEMRAYAKLYEEMEVAADEAEAAISRLNDLRELAASTYQMLAATESAKFQAALYQLGASAVTNF